MWFPRNFSSLMWFPCNFSSLMWFPCNFSSLMWFLCNVSRLKRYFDSFSAAAGLATLMHYDADLAQHMGPGSPARDSRSTDSPPAGPGRLRQPPYSPETDHSTTPPRITHQSSGGSQGGAESPRGRWTRVTEGADYRGHGGTPRGRGYRKGSASGRIWFSIPCYSLRLLMF